MFNLTSQDQKTSGLISEHQYIPVSYVLVFLWGSFALLGMVTNGINIRTYLKMGLQDGVTISFLVLSVSDFGFSVARMGHSGSEVIAIMDTRFSFKLYVEPYTVSYLNAHISLMIYVITILTTTYLAVAKCMCIVKPLHFKRDFSKRRSILFLFFFVLFAFASYMPIFVTMGLVEDMDPLNNVTRMMFLLTPERERVKDIVWIIIDVLLPISTQVIVVVCVVVMARGLHEVQKFRHANAGNAAAETKEGAKNVLKSKRKEKYKASPSSSKLSGKELQVIQQVVVISVVYILCNTPKIFTTLLGVAEPEFALGMKEHYLYVICSGFRSVLEQINSSVNLFIYIKFNTKFKEHCSFC